MSNIPMHFFVILLVYVFKILQSVSDAKKITEEYKRAWVEKILIKDLLKDYDLRSRPVVDNVTFVFHEIERNEFIQQVTVEFGLSLIQILELDEMDQILTSNVRTLYRWMDHHLRWEPALYENITHVHIPTKYLWLPDISIYNYADERMEERRECDAIVKFDGTIEWHPMAIFKSTCPVRIKFFPFDQQCCKLKFGPWTYDGFRVNITFYDNKTDLDQSRYITNAEWELIKTEAEFSNYRYPCCPEPYPDISFHILVKRNSAFYNYILILPCFLLSSLTLVLFWLPSESPAKMVLGMNIFIAFFLLVVLLEKSIPSASSSFPLIGTYYCINMTLITLSTFLCLIVVNFHFRGDNRKEVPFWLKKLTIKHGARILFVDLGPLIKKPIPSEILPPKRKSSKSHKNPQQLQNNPSTECRMISGTQFYDPFYQQNFTRRIHKANPNYFQSNHLRYCIEATDFKNSRANTPDCAAASSSIFDRYPVADNSSGNDEEIEEDLNYCQQNNQSNYFKDYEEDLEEFLTECIQSPNQNTLAASWASYNSAADFSNNLRQGRAQDLNYHIRSQKHDLKTGSCMERRQSNKHSLNTTNVYVSRRVNLVTKDITDIIKDLNLIKKSNENKDKVNKIVSEWRAVGLVLDRFFFIIYIIAIVLSLILFFPKAGDNPYMSKGKLDCDANV